MRSVCVKRAKNWVAGLAVAAAFLLGASSASALAISLGGLPVDTVPGGTVSVTVTIDTGATTGIVLLSVGVLFDETKLSYDKPASSATSYALYGGRGGGGFLGASSTCGGYPTDGTACSLRVGTDNQVNIDYVSADLTNGTANTGSFLAATLVFNVIGTSGSAAISLSTSLPGNTVTLGTGPGTAALSGDGSVNIIPEPTTALLVGLGLAGLGVAGRRRA
jgi:hypothetical protein